MHKPTRAGSSLQWSAQLARLALAGLAWTSGAQAQTETTKPGLQGTQFMVENDVFARGKTDRWFTNGLRYTQTWQAPREQEEPLSAMLLSAGDYLLGAKVDKAAMGTRSLSWTLGQNMYTPRRIDLARPQRGDRPWAGWLYGGATVHGFKGDDFQQTDLKLGWTGHYSGAGQLQRAFHRAVDATYPAGWEQQLKPRLGVQLSHMRMSRMGDETRKQWVGGDFFGFHFGYGATVGTLRSYATVMGGLVAGDLRGRNPVFALSNDGDLVVQDFSQREAFQHLLFFANVSGTAVADNQFITGSTPYGRSEIELKRWVTAWQWGLSVPLSGWRKGLRLVFSQSARTSEFSSPILNAQEGVQRWGTLTFNLDH